MATVKFYLKTPEKQESCIFSYIHFNYYTVDLDGGADYKFIKYYLRDSVVPVKYWDKKNQRAKDTKSYPEHTELNLYLDNFKTNVINIVRKLQNDKTHLTPDIIRNELDKIYKPVSLPPKITLFEFIDDYIKNIKIIYRNGKPYQINPRTISKYKTAQRVLINYANKKRKGILDFNDIDLEFYTDFITYLQKENYSDNTIGKFIQNIKTFLNNAAEKGINVNSAYKNKKFACPQEEVDKVYLTEKELTKLYELDLTRKSGLDLVRDLFLIGCYTALRYSDYTNIRPENIYNSDNGEYIKINTFKTQKNVIIPINSRVKEIIIKYGNDLPRSISNQKSNEYLKELCKMALINDPVSIAKTIGGLRTEKTEPKYKYVSTHTARRSGATNMFINGIAAHSIMIITGHKTEKAFLTYLRFSEEDNAKIIQNNPFFFSPEKEMKVI